jgi:tRNA1(Val) A37 N6-methylase TrmN6
MRFLRRSNEGGSTQEPIFGTYHHSTSTASNKIREDMKTMFIDAFASLPYGRDDDLRILDVGCGLGFLSCVSAQFYKNARIIGIDTFKHPSLKRSSLEKAKENVRILGLLARIDLKDIDILRFTPSRKFDIIVSNLVFHNLGKNRFEAYSRLSSWAHVGSHILMGDLFFSPRIDMVELAKLLMIVRKIKSKRDFGQYALLVMSKDFGRNRLEAKRLTKF